MYLEMINYDRKTDNFIMTAHYIFTTFTSIFGRFLTWVCFLAFFIFTLLVPIQLDGANIPLSTLFIPAIILNGILFCGSILYLIDYARKKSENSNIPSKIAFSSVLFVTSACLLTFFILLYVKLLNPPQYWSWFTVATPLFVLEGMIFIFGFIGGIFYSFSNYTDKPNILLCWCCGWLFVIPLVLTNQVFILQKLEGADTASWGVIFTPLYVMEAVIFYWLMCIQCSIFCWE